MTEHHIYLILPPGIRSLFDSKVWDDTMDCIRQTLRGQLRMKEEDDVFLHYYVVQRDRPFDYDDCVDILDIINSDDEIVYPIRYGKDTELPHYDVQSNYEIGVAQMLGKYPIHVYI